MKSFYKNNNVKFMNNNFEVKVLSKYTRYEMIGENVQNNVYNNIIANDLSYFLGTKATITDTTNGTNIAFGTGRD